MNITIIAAALAISGGAAALVAGLGYRMKRHKRLLEGTPIPWPADARRHPVEELRYKTTAVYGANCTTTYRSSLDGSEVPCPTDTHFATYAGSYTTRDATIIDCDCDDGDCDSCQDEYG